MDPSSEAVPQPKPKAPGVISGRLMSLDALRGFDMFWIVGGWWIFHRLYEIYPNNAFTSWMNRQLDHVKWEGFHFEDLIMPLFLFIVGTAMPFSFNKYLTGGRTKGRLYFHIVKRVLILWILGMTIQGNLLTYDVSKFKLYSRRLPVCLDHHA
jgi:predicted acyltransferase